MDFFFKNWVAAQKFKNFEATENQAQRNQVGSLGAGGLQSPQIFAKVDLLTIDNDNNEKSEIAKKINK